MTPVFDGHNDVLLRLWSKKTADPAKDFVNGDGLGHLDLPRMVKGGFAGGFFAIFVPSPNDLNPADDEELNPPDALEVSHSPALAATLDMVSLCTGSSGPRRAGSRCAGARPRFAAL